MLTMNVNHRARLRSRHRKFLASELHSTHMEAFELQFSSLFGTLLSLNDHTADFVWPVALFGDHPPECFFFGEKRARGGEKGSCCV